DRGHEVDGDAAVDPGQGDRGELELVREHGAVLADEVGDQVDPGRGVGGEGDLVGPGPDEPRDLGPDYLAGVHPPVPVEVAAVLEVAVELVDGLAHDPGRWRSGGRVQVDLVPYRREVSPDLVPLRRHKREG